MGSTISHLQPVIAGTRRTLCCHSATLSGHFSANSLEAVDECATAGVPRIEVDVRFMADDSMLIFHNEALDDVTTGYGRVAEMDHSEIRGIRYNSGQREALCFMQDVVERLSGTDTILQVDLKLMRPISAARARSLEAVLEPLGANVIVGSQAHWNLRELRGVPVALDPTLHWHYAPARRTVRPPHTLGVHGLWDDSPLALDRQVRAADYIEARITELRALLPSAVEWMVDIATINYLGRLGVNLGSRLRAEDCSLAAWTLKETTPRRAECLVSLFELGAETVITDAPLVLAADATVAPL